ncbi:hypothetical protein CLAIMM_13673 [Cladophialophora immunda]|nr:hypothetical protein CLAIMM_13673 [Cladophialophora immunda]
MSEPTAAFLPVPQQSHFSSRQTPSSPFLSSIFHFIFQALIIMNPSNMAGGATINQDEQQQIPAGGSLDRTALIQPLRLGQILHETDIGLELPRKRTGLTPVARDKFGVPVVMSNLPQKKAGARKRKTQRQTESPRSVQSVTAPLAPAPASAPSSTNAQKPNKESTATASGHVNNKDEAAATTDGRTAEHAQRPARAKSAHGPPKRGRTQQPGKLTLISAEQLGDLRADLIQSAKDNSDLRHEVDVLERKLAQSEEERRMYWSCGLEWARREKGLCMELEYWKAQAGAATQDNIGDDGGAVQYGFVGGRDFDVGFQAAQHHQGGTAQGIELGLDIPLSVLPAAGHGAVDADFGARFGTGFDRAPDHLVATADELDKERDVMLRMD